jgi:hypothetical protein
LADDKGEAAVKGMALQEIPLKGAVPETKKGLTEGEEIGDHGLSFLVVL